MHPPPPPRTGVLPPGRAGGAAGQATGRSTAAYGMVSCGWSKIRGHDSRGAAPTARAGRRYRRARRRAARRGGGRAARGTDLPAGRRTLGGSRADWVTPVAPLLGAGARPRATVELGRVLAQRPVDHDSIAAPSRWRRPGCSPSLANADRSAIIDEVLEHEATYGLPPASVSRSAASTVTMRTSRLGSAAIRPCAPRSWRTPGSTRLIRNACGRVAIRTSDRREDLGHVAERLSTRRARGPPAADGPHAGERPQQVRSSPTSPPGPMPGTSRSAR